jgi:hypothetical protein
VVQHPAHSIHQIHPYFGAQVRLRELLHQVQKLFSPIVVQGVSQPGFLPGFSWPGKASVHGVCGIQLAFRFGLAPEDTNAVRKFFARIHRVIDKELRKR